MIEERLSQADAQGGFILDGFPRTVAQAQVLENILARQHQRLDHVVAITVPDDEIVKRISGRRTCRTCGAMYHVAYEPPRSSDKCDKCGGELYQREDDAEGIVRERLQVYATSTRPLLDYYGSRRLLTEIEGMGRPDEIEQRIMSALVL
jgi:adenylate kinase